MGEADVEVAVAPLPGRQEPTPCDDVARVPAPARRAFDLVVLAALVVVSYLARRGTLPSDGLWFDDSWVAAGAVLGSPRALLSVGSGHPGFTALLMAVDRIGGGDLAHLGVPSLVAGVAAPPVLYLVLRRIGYERALSALVSAALVVAPIHILYSGRVKGYTLDTLGVLLLTVALPALARRAWRWPLAAAWFVVAVGVGLLSGYMLVATALAGLVLVLHPTGDRRIRAAAVGAQAVVQGVYLRTAQSKTDLAGIEEVMEEAYDGHITFSWNPFTFGRESVRHLGRVAEVFPGGSGGWLTAFGLVAVVGLVAGAARGRTRSESLAARYLLLLVVVAYVGSILDRFPFGPTNDHIRSAGGRHTLWLIAAMAVGLAAAGHRVRAWAAGRDLTRFGFDAACVITAIVVVATGYEAAQPAPFPGSDTATRFVEEALGPDDVVIISGSATFSYALSTTTPVGVVSTPDHQIGFAPVYDDPQIYVDGGWAATDAAPRTIRAWVADAERVYVPGYGPLGGGGLNSVGEVLEADGFRKERRVAFDYATVEVWIR